MSSSGIKPRHERFTIFQSLIAEMKNAQDANPASFLTRLYNSLTSELTKAEAEITRLHSASHALTAELQSLKGATLQVSKPRKS
jgi:predicted  nucleic acid-binding Zn-ribbon protein